jgi:hypothetical protein
MASLEGRTEGDRHLTWMAKRSVQIFDIFDQVRHRTTTVRRAYGTA